MSCTPGNRWNFRRRSFGKEFWEGVLGRSSGVQELQEYGSQRVAGVKSEKSNAHGLNEEASRLAAGDARFRGLFCNS
jgi:hypothetical protein